jgi:hypothetical protein
MPLTLIIEILMCLINKKITYKIKYNNQYSKDKIFIAKTLSRSFKVELNFANNKYVYVKVLAFAIIRYLL